MRRLLFFLLLLTGTLAPGELAAQQPDPLRCDHATLMREGDTFYRQQNYRAALRKYNAARICDPGQGTAVDAAIDKLFTAIEKQRDEAKRQRARAEEALKVAEAEKLKTQKEKNRADSLLGVSNAALARAEAALLAVEEATVQIVQTLLRDAQEDIRLLRYEGALEKLHSAARLVRGKAPGSPLDRIRPEVGRAMMEPAFFYTEAGKYPQAALELRLADSLLSDGTGSAWTLLPADTATHLLPRYREMLAALDRTAYDRLRLRYYPDMAPVPGGTFIMGDNEGDSDEKPEHPVTLDSFQIARTELTFWQYHLYLAATGARRLEDLGPLSWGFLGDNPVVNVSWYDAAAYLNWLSGREGLEGAYEITGEQAVRILKDRNGYRLPTEAEWEYAAGGGRADRDAEGRRRYAYAGSDTLDQVGWYRENAANRTQTVARKAPNGLGLYDLSGNVWQWCQDNYEAYSIEHQYNPLIEISIERRVLRGGSWSSNANGCRVALRVNSNAVNRGILIGFRPARDLP